MCTSESPEPLRNIPIQIVIDGTEITGEILSAQFNDIWVVIHSPVSGFGTGLHVPWFRYGYPQFALATQSRLTERGAREARWAAQGVVRVFARTAVRVGYLASERKRAVDGDLGRLKRKQHE